MANASPAAAAREPLDRRDATNLALIAALYLLLVGTTLDWHGYWSDEFHTIRATSLPWQEMIRERAAQGHPPLFFLLEKAWISVAGTSEMGTRSLPMLCGLASLLLTYVIVRGEVERRAACLACGLLALGATQLLICQLARSYALLQLLMTAQTALVLSSRPPAAWRMAAAALLSAAALYTHGAALVAIPAHLAASAVALPEKWRQILAAAAGCLLYVPFWLAFREVQEIEDHLNWVPYPTVTALLRFPALLQFGRYINDVPPLIQGLATLLLVASGLAALVASDRAAFLALQWFFAWALVAAAAGAWGVGIVSVERYFAPALVCQAGLVALTWTAAAQKGRWLSVGMLAAHAAVAIGSAGLYSLLPPFTAWREMAELIREHRSADETVVVASPAVLATPFAYYYDGEASYIGEAALPQPGNTAAGLWVCFREADPEVESRVTAQAERLGFTSPLRHSFHRGVIRHFRRLRGRTAHSPHPTIESPP